MPIKDINELLNMTIVREKKKRFSERIKPKVNPKYTEMGDVVPPLSRVDFLNCWKEDRRELEKIRTEKDKVSEQNKKLRAVMNTTWSKDWPNEVSKIFKEGKDDKAKT